MASELIHDGRRPSALAPMILPIVCGALVGMLALQMGRLRHLSALQGARMLEQFRALPGLVEKALACDAEVRRIAEKYARSSSFLYLGRQYLYPVALEGALKLKEISYIHAEGYPAAEMKHGPIALVEDGLPLLVLLPPFAEPLEAEPDVAAPLVVGDVIAPPVAAPPVAVPPFALPVVAKPPAPPVDVDIDTLLEMFEAMRARREEILGSTKAIPVTTDEDRLLVATIAKRQLAWLAASAAW